MVRDVQEKGLCISTVTVPSLLSKAVDLKLGVSVQRFYVFILIVGHKFGGRSELFICKPLLRLLSGSFDCVTVNLAVSYGCIRFCLLCSFSSSDLFHDLLQAIDLSSSLVVALLLIGCL
jgi:hypothetical protein